MSHDGVFVVKHKAGDGCVTTKRSCGSSAAYGGGGVCGRTDSGVEVRRKVILRLGRCGTAFGDATELCDVDVNSMKLLDPVVLCRNLWARLRTESLKLLGPSRGVE
jgi:hypothetical protein